MSDLQGSWSIAQDATTQTYTYTVKDGDNTAYTVTVTGLSLGGKNVNETYNDGDLAVYLDDEASPTKVVVSSELLNNSTVHLTVTKGESWSGTVPTLTLDVSDYTTEEKATEAENWSVSADGTATYNKYKLNYYTMSEDSKTLTFHDKSTAVAVYELTGLSGLTAREYTVAEMSASGISSASTDDKNYTVTLNETLVGSGSTVTLVDKLTGADDDELDFNAIALAGDSGAGLDVSAISGDGKIGLITTNAWSVSGTDEKAYYTQTTTEGWQVSDDKLSVTHTAGTSVNLLTVTGISSGATKDDFSIADNTTVVTLGESAIGDNTISISGNSTLEISNTKYSDFTLEFANFANHSVVTDQAAFVGESGTYTYQQLTNAGFTFAEGNKTATHSDSSTNYFFKLTGISSISGVTVNQPTTKKTYTITLGASALKDADVQLTDLNGVSTGNATTDGYDYSLTLANGISDTHTLTPYWSVDGDSNASTTATYKFDTAAGWSLASTSKVEYHQETLSTAIATITGLSAKLSIEALSSGIEYDATNKTFTLNKYVLGGQSVNFSASTAAGYSLSLAGDYAVKDKNPYFSVSAVTSGDSATTVSNTLIYEYDKTQGWSSVGGSYIAYTGAVSGIDKFVITGLSATGLTVAGADSSSVSGVTLDADTGVITLADSVLMKDNSNTVSLSSADGGNYSLSLAAGVTKYATMDSAGKHWTLNTGGGSATFLFNSQEGFSLNGNSIAYKESEATEYFTVTGLSSNVNAAAVSAAAVSAVFGASFTEGTTNFFTLSKAQLNSIVDKTKGLSLVDNDINDDYTFGLSLAADAKIDYGTIGSDSAIVVKKGLASIQASILDYYDTVEGGGISHYAKSGTSKIVATIEGIKTKSTSVVGASLSGSTIILDKTALNGKDIVIHDEHKDDEENYSLSFAAGVAVGGVSVYEYGASGWSVAEGGTSATFLQNVYKGYTLENGGQSISFDNETVLNTAKFFTITGLSNATEGAFKVNETTNKIYINDSALGTSDIVLSVLDSSAWSGYSGIEFNNAPYQLALYTNQISNKGASYYSVETVAASGEGEDSVPASTTVKYNQDTPEGFKLSDNGLSAKYIAEATENFFTITGLNDKITATDSTDSVAGITLQNGVITLQKSALTGHNVSLSRAEGSNYSLSLAAGISDAYTLDSYWGATEGESGYTKATYQYDTTEGWALSAGSMVVNYTAATKGNSLAVITGLSAGLDAAALSAGITYAAGTSTFTLDKSVLSRDTNTSISLSGDGYKLALGASTAVTQEANYFSLATVAAESGGISSTSITYRFDMSEGWALNNESTAVNYTARDEETNKLFTLTGLSYGLSLDGKPATFAGISVTALADSGNDDKNWLVTLDKNVLSGQDVKLIDNNTSDHINFSLSVAGDVHEVASLSAYFTVNGTSAVYQYENEEGWKVVGDSVVYTEHSNPKTLFTIEGLSAGLSATGTPAGISGISVSGAIVTLDESVLGKNDITFTDAEGGLSYVVALGGSYVTAQSASYFSASAAGDSTTTLTYQYDNAYGWSLSGGNVKYTAPTDAVTVFTIEGLNYSLSGTSGASSVAGITVNDSAKTITFTDDEALAGKGITLNNNTAGYSFAALGASVTAYKTKADEGDKWVVSGSSATFLYDNQPGYTWASASSITYTGLSTTKFVTIEGLSTGVTAAALSTAFGVSSASGTHIFTLSKALLGGTSVTLTDENDADGVNFKFALNADATLGTISDATFKVSGSDVILQANLPDYYTLGTDSTSINFVAAGQSRTLATIAGISSTAGLSLADDYTTIVLGASALTTKGNITLTDNYSRYSLSIANSVNDYLNDNGEGYWTIGGTNANRTFTYQRDVYLGYHLEDEGKKIAYYGGSDYIDHSEAFMKLEGLNGDAVAENFSISGTNVILDDGAIGEKTITLKITDGATAYNGYSLSFANPDNFAHVAGESYWSASSTSGSYVYKQDTSAGFSIAGQTATYAALSTADFFTISGLKENLTGTEVSYTGRFDGEDTTGKFAGLTGISISGTKITLTEDALNEEGVEIEKSTGNNATYTLALSGVAAPDDLDETLGYNGRYWTKTDDGFVLNFNTGAGYTTDGTSVIYTASTSAALATVTGLDTSIVVGTAGASFGKLGTVSGTTFTEISGLSALMSNIGLSNGGVITLNKALLGSDSVSVSGTSYTLAITEDVLAPVSQSGTLYWAVDDSETSLAYQYNITEGYTLNGASTTLGYSAATVSAVATFTGLDTEVIGAISSALADGEAITDYITIGTVSGTTVFTLTNAALSGLSDNDTVSLEAGAGYGLSLATGVATTAADKTKFEVDNGTAEFLGYSGAYYTLSGKEITYTAEGTIDTLLTISGLSSGFDGTGLIGVKYQAAVEDDKTTEADETQAEVIGTITLPAKALSTTEIEINNPNYKLVLADGIDAPRTAGGTWEDIDNGSTTYSAKVTRAGYAVSADGQKVTYTPISNSVEIVSISGLGENAKKTDLTVNTGTRIITVAANALGEDDVSVDGVNDLGYKLAINKESGEAAGYYTTEHKANVWREDDTPEGTYYFKQVTLAYYTYDETTNKIVYHEEADVTGKTFVKITGLSSGLTTDDKGNIFAADGNTNLLTISDVTGGFVTETTAAADESAVKTITINSKDALGETTGATIDSNYNYKFVLNESLLPVASNHAWSVTPPGTAEYQADFTEGYDLDSTGKTVTYVAETTTPKTIAEITGLSTDVTDKDGVIGIETTKDGVTTFTAGGISVSGTTFTITKDEMLRGGNTDDTKAVTITTEYIAGSEKPQDGYTTPTYTLALSGVTGSDVATVNKWAEDTNNKFTYSTYKPAYYTLGGDSTTIAYTAEVKKGSDLVTLTGLNNDVKVSDDGQIGIETTEDGKTTFTAGISVNDTMKRVTLNAAVLGETGIDLTSTANYTLAKGSDVTTTAKDSYALTTEEVVDTNKTTTATLTNTPSEYYTFTSNKVTYHAAADANKVTTKITGLASGLSAVDGTGKDEGVIFYLKTGTGENAETAATIDTDNATITLTENAVDGKNNITLTSDDYTLKIDNTIPTTSDDKTKWVINGSEATGYTAAYTPYTTASYKLNGKTLTCTPAADKTASFTISGLNTNDADKIEAGLTVKDGVVTVSSDLLGTKEVSITDEGYTLALEGGEKTLGFGVKENWSLAKDSETNPTKQTATGTVAVAEGWTLGEKATKITHTAANTTTFTLDNLSKDVKTYEATDGSTRIGTTATSKGKVTETPYIDVDTTGKKVEIKNEKLLNENTVNFTDSSNSYTLALDTSVSTFVPEGYQFVQEKGATKATYQKLITKDSYSCDGSKITFNAAADSTVLATIDGLKKAGVAVTASELDGVTFTATDATDPTDPTKGGTFTISAAAMDHSKLKANAYVTLTNSELTDKSTFAGKLALGNDLTKSDISDPGWVVKNGTGTYQQTNSNGYNVSTDGTKITYYYGTPTTLFTLGGLSKTVTADALTNDVIEVAAISADGSTTSTTTDPYKYVVTLKDKDVLAGGKVTLTDKTNTYMLAVDDSIDPETVNERLVVSGTTAMLKAGTTSGYAMVADKKATDGVSKTVASFNKENLNVTYATISGLPKVDNKTITEDDIKDGITYTGNATNGYEFTVYSDMLLKATKPGTIKIKDGKASAEKTAATVKTTLSIDNEVLTSKKWLTDAKGNATYVTYYEQDGFEQTDKQTLTYKQKSVEKTAKDGTVTGVTNATQIFKLSGLSDLTAKLSDEDDGTGSALNGITIADEVDSTTKEKTGNTIITVSNDRLGASNVKVTGTGYKLAIGEGVQTTKPTSKSQDWTISGTKATLTEAIGKYYTYDSAKNTIVYNKPSESATLVTLSGIKSGAKDGTDFTLDTTTHEITLNAGALTNSNVTLALGKNVTGYSLELGTGIAEVTYNDSAFGTLSKGKATLTKSVKADGYTLTNDKLVTYTNAATANKKLPVLATISGVSSLDGTTVSDSTKVVTLDAKALGTSAITLTGNYGYHFDETNVNTVIGDKAPTVTLNESKTTMSKGALTFNGTSTAGFIFSDFNTINYLKAIGTSARPGKLASVSGLSKSLTLDGIKSTFNESTRTVTLAASDLDSLQNGKVTAEGSGIIAFNFGDFSGTVSGSGSSTTVKAATISGGNNNDTITSGGSNLLISTAKGNDSIIATGSSVTINADVGNDFINASGSNVSIMGGAGNDSVTIIGSNVSINAGVGDDVVDMGSGSSNMFIYAVKDGNDTVSNFTAASDKIKLSTANAKVTVEASGDDAVVTVTDSSGKNAGTITLTDRASYVASIQVLDTNNKNLNTAASSDLASSADVISDNYFDESPQLSEVLGTSYDAVSTDEFGTSYDATQLGKQTVVYGAKK